MSKNNEKTGHFVHLDYLKMESVSKSNENLATLGNHVYVIQNR